MSGATDHLPRLLALVPWLMAHPGIELVDAAREFDVTEAQLRKDLELLWMCGLPGYGPGDLIDIDWHGERVTLSNADEIARPLRLTSLEALALIAALRELSDVPGIIDRGAVERVLAKLEAAAGTTTASDRVVAAPTPSAPAEVITSVTDGIARGRRLHLRYWVAARDEATVRDVDPIRLFNADGNVYLSGWCYQSDDIRTFRLDRVLEVSVLDLPVEVTEANRERAFTASLFTPSPDDKLVTMTLDPAARWVADYYPCEDVVERGDGGLEVKLRVHDDAWVRRLALGLAGMGRVTDPPELSEEIRNLAISTLAAYDA
jgi:proteasome accessory factor C